MSTRTVKSTNVAPQLLSKIQESFSDEPKDDDGKPKHACESLTTVE
jgi:hypothetical protein